MLVRSCYKHGDNLWCINSFHDDPANKRVERFVTCSRVCFNSIDSHLDTEMRTRRAMICCAVHPDNVPKFIIEHHRLLHRYERLWPFSKACSKASKGLCMDFSWLSSELGRVMLSNRGLKHKAVLERQYKSRTRVLFPALDKGIKLYLWSQRTKRNCVSLWSGASPNTKPDSMLHRSRYIACPCDPISASLLLRSEARPKGKVPVTFLYTFPLTPKLAIKLPTNHKHGWPTYPQHQPGRHLGLRCLY